MLLLITIFILTGCTATYNLEISPDGFKENIVIKATNENENNLIEEFPVGAYYGSKENDSNPMLKIDGQEYYDSTIETGDDNLKIAKYSYLFDYDNFSEANSVVTSFENFIMKKYDYNEDGVNDYVLISSGKDFNKFEKNEDLELVTININCHYEVISSNADEVKNGVHTWYLTKDNIKAINMVYNPDKVVDYRSFWEKLLDGEYFNIFTVSVFIFIIGIIVYFVVKKKGDRKNKV